MIRSYIKGVLEVQVYFNLGDKASPLKVDNAQRC
jgi:hypothetical protein